MEHLEINSSEKINGINYELLEVIGEDDKRALLEVRKLNGKKIFNVFWFKDTNRFSKVFSHYIVN